MENPCVAPVETPRTIHMIHSTAPRAARAWTPATCPTTMVSTIVYSCWQILPSISGIANIISSLPGGPFVISLICCPAIQSSVCTSPSVMMARIFFYSYHIFALYPSPHACMASRISFRLPFSSISRSCAVRTFKIIIILQDKNCINYFFASSNSRRYCKKIFAALENT